MNKSETLAEIREYLLDLRERPCKEREDWSCPLTGDGCEICFIDRLLGFISVLDGRKSPNPTPWTPIDEDMPEDYQLVLLSIEPTEENTGGTAYVMIDRWIQGDYEEGWHDFWEIDESLWRVAAWMPLPAPYERWEDEPV